MHVLSTLIKGSDQQALVYRYFRERPAMLSPVLVALIDRSYLNVVAASPPGRARELTSRALLHEDTDTIHPASFPDMLEPVQDELLLLACLCGQARFLHLPLDLSPSFLNSFLEVGHIVLATWLVCSTTHLSGKPCPECSIRSLLELLLALLIEPTTNLSSIRPLLPWSRCEATKGTDKTGQVIINPECQRLMDEKPLLGCSRCYSVSYCRPGTWIPLSRLLSFQQRPDFRRLSSFPSPTSD